MRRSANCTHKVKQARSRSRRQMLRKMQGLDEISDRKILTVARTASIKAFEMSKKIYYQSRITILNKFGLNYAEFYDNYIFNHCPYIFVRILAETKQIIIISNGRQNLFCSTLRCQIILTVSISCQDIKLQWTGHLVLKKFYFFPFSIGYCAINLLGFNSYSEKIKPWLKECDSYQNQCNL